MRFLQFTSAVKPLRSQKLDCLFWRRNNRQRPIGDSSAKAHPAISLFSKLRRRIIKEIQFWQNPLCLEKLWNFIWQKTGRLVESNFLAENRSRTKCVFLESSFALALKRCTGGPAGPCCYCPVFQKKADFCATAISASCKIDVGPPGGRCLDSTGFLQI